MKWRKERLISNCIMYTRDMVLISWKKEFAFHPVRSTPSSLIHKRFDHFQQPRGVSFYQRTQRWCLAHLKEYATELTSLECALSVESSWPVSGFQIRTIWSAEPETSLFLSWEYANDCQFSTLDIPNTDYLVRRTRGNMRSGLIVWCPILTLSRLLSEIQWATRW